MTEVRYIIFCLDEEVYSMNLKYVKEIEENYAIIPIPNGTAHIKGIMNLRGEVVPVYSLRSRFGKAERRETGRLILTYVHDTVIGFEVDKIQGIEDIEEQDMLSVPRMIMNEETTYIDCVIRASSGIVVNISVENLLPESEVQAINERISENEQ